MGAQDLLKRFGKAALEPQKIGDFWRKARVSARQAADLRRKTLFEGGTWEYEKEPKVYKRFVGPFGQYKKAKGHKVDELKQDRQKKIEENMAKMPDMIAKYRESRKVKPASLLDELFLRPKELRLRQYRNPNQK